MAITTVISTDSVVPMDNTSKVRFSREQLEYLNKRFPEPIVSAKMSDADMCFATAQRSVVLQLLHENGGKLHVHI